MGTTHRTEDQKLKAKDALYKVGSLDSEHKDNESHSYANQTNNYPTIPAIPEKLDQRISSPTVRVKGKSKNKSFYTPDKTYQELSKRRYPELRRK